MLEIRNLRKNDVLAIAKAFEVTGWNKPISQFERYLIKQNEGKRKVFVAFVGGELVGYLTILFESNYPPFKAAKIPEINDFNILPQFRRKGFGTKLMNKAEEFVEQTSKTVGIGVGLDADYGAAQKLYVLRGYVPDTRGIVWRNHFPKYGEQVTIDDDLNLYFTKNLS